MWLRNSNVVLQVLNVFSGCWNVNCTLSFLLCKVNAMASTEIFTNADDEESSGSDIDSYDESSDEGQYGILGSPFPGILNVQMRTKTSPGGAFMSHNSGESDVMDTSCNDLEAPSPEKTWSQSHNSPVGVKGYGCRDLSKFVKIENALRPAVQLKQENVLNVSVQTGPMIHQELEPNSFPAHLNHISPIKNNNNFYHDVNGYQIQNGKTLSDLYNSDDLFNGEEDWSSFASDLESSPEVVRPKTQNHSPTDPSPVPSRKSRGRSVGSYASDSDSYSYEGSEESNQSVRSPKKRRKRAHFLSSSSESSSAEDDDVKQELIDKGICPFCKKSFSRQSALKGHMVLCKTNKNRVDSSFSSACSTPVKKYSAKRPLKCVSSKFKRKKTKIQKTKEAVLEPVKKKIRCSLCTTKLDSLAELLKHMKGHSLEVSQSGKRSTRNQTVIKQENEDASCEDSNYNRLFKELKSLGDSSWGVGSKDIKTEGKESNNENDNHCCLYCSKSFFRKVALESHMKIHSVGNLGPLINSPRTRARSFAMDRRLGLIDGSNAEDLRVYTCEICGDCFTRRSLYINHVKDRHSIESPKLAAILKSSNSSFTVGEICETKERSLVEINGNKSISSIVKNDNDPIEETIADDKLHDFDIFKKKNCRILIPRVQEK